MTADQPRIRLSREQRDELRRISVTLHEKARPSIWGVPLRVCRAYVWAVFSGGDPVDACRAAWFGDSTSPAILAHAREQVAGCRAVGLDIPTMARAA